jgi:hypothetical protein
MKTKFAVAATAAMLLAPVIMPASAQLYINAGVSGYNFNNGFNPRAFTGRVGYDAGPYVALEGEASLGMIEDNGEDLESDVAAYVLGKLPLAGSFHVFGRIGYSLLEASSFEGDGFGYGIGGQYNWGKSGLRVDWTRREYDEDSVDAWSIAYAYSF